MTAALATRHCQPLKGHPAMGAELIEQHLLQVPGWALVDGAIQKRYDFADYHRTMAFVNAVAFVAHTQDHHPDLLVSYNQCTVRYNTHSVGGLSINDFICAARVDVLLDRPLP